jgi:hypothetical protein
MHKILLQSLFIFTLLSCGGHTEDKPQVDPDFQAQAAEWKPVHWTLPPSPDSSLYGLPKAFLHPWSPPPSKDQALLQAHEAIEWLQKTKGIYQPLNTLPMTTRPGCESLMEQKTVLKAKGPIATFSGLGALDKPEACHPQDQTAGSGDRLTQFRMVGGLQCTLGELGALGASGFKWHWINDGLAKCLDGTLLLVSNLQATTEKVGYEGSKEVTMDVEKFQSALQSTDGTPCRVTKTFGKMELEAGCRISWIREIAKTPSLKPETVSFMGTSQGKLTIELNKPYFSSGKFLFTLNQWWGFVEFKSGLEPPTFQITNGVETQSGTLL